MARVGIEEEEHDAGNTVHDDEEDEEACALVRQAHGARLADADRREVVHDVHERVADAAKLRTETLWRVNPTDRQHVRVRMRLCGFSSGGTHPRGPRVALKTALIAKTQATVTYCAGTFTGSPGMAGKAMRMAVKMA